MYNKANVSVYPVNKLLNEKVKHHKHCNKQNDYNISIRSNIIITSIGTLYSPDSNNNFFKYKSFCLTSIGCIIVAMIKTTLKF